MMLKVNKIINHFFFQNNFLEKIIIFTFVSFSKQFFYFFGSRFSLKNPFLNYWRFNFSLFLEIYFFLIYNKCSSHKIKKNEFFFYSCRSSCVENSTKSSEILCTHKHWIWECRYFFVSFAKRSPSKWFCYSKRSLVSRSATTTSFPW